MELGSEIGNFEHGVFVGLLFSGPFAVGDPRFIDEVNFSAATTCLPRIMLSFSLLEGSLLYSDFCFSIRSLTFWTLASCVAFLFYFRWPGDCSTSSIKLSSQCSSCVACNAFSLSSRVVIYFLMIWPTTLRVLWSFSILCMKVGPVFFTAICLKELKRFFMYGSHIPSKLSMKVLVHESKLVVILCLVLACSSLSFLTRF